MPPLQVLYLLPKSYTAVAHFKALSTLCLQCAAVCYSCRSVHIRRKPLITVRMAATRYFLKYLHVLSLDCLLFSFCSLSQTLSPIFLCLSVSLLSLFTFSFFFNSFEGFFRQFLYSPCLSHLLHLSVFLHPSLSF